MYILKTFQLGRKCLYIIERKMIFIPRKGSKTGYTIPCETCGKEIYQTKTQYNRAKHHFCSTKCQMVYQHKQTHEYRICPICNQKFETLKRLNQQFCSTKCQNEWQKTNIGEKNVRFQGKVCNCDWCGKKISVGKNKYEKSSYHFCSTKCRQDWYTNVYSQEENWKEQSRIRAVKILKDKGIGIDTKPQVIINDLLSSMDIRFTNEKNIKYYSLDNYLDDFNLAIEVMGDFWHTNPIVYPEYPTKSIQIKRIPKDKAKHTYIKNNYGYEVLYLWENDIYNNLDLCRLLIQKYVDQYGVLENYNSFNYHIENNDLVINSEIIQPYFLKEKPA